MKNSDKVIVE
jgi:hypothetical protein